MGMYLINVHLTGRAPHRRVSHGRAPHGRVPHGRVPHGRTPHRRVLYGRVYCGRDKGMPIGRLYDREGMAMMGGQSLETRLG